MRRIKGILRFSGAIATAILFTGGWAAPAWADSASAPSLTISQLKITSDGGQFITLFNPTERALDMSQYQLEYFNNFDLAKATSSKLISLSGSVPPHGYFMVSDGLYTMCYQLTVDSVSLGLSSTAGMVEVLSFEQSGPGGSAAPVLQDYVGWSKKPAAGAQTLPADDDAFLERQPVDAANNPAVGAPGAGGWQPVQPDADDRCELVSSQDGQTPMPTGLVPLLPPTEPPATIASLNSAAAGAAAPALPPADIGLIAPEVTEVLPNPAGTGNDGTDEFVELYNPNKVSFDLSGFGLQAGTKSLHTYVFAAGTKLAPQHFMAFYSAATHLSLSNSGGELKLLDPFGNSLSATAVYAAAKDGQSWDLAKGKWYWTTKPTPGAANVINQPAAAKKKAAAKSSKTGGKAAGGSAGIAGESGPAGDADSAGLLPIHFETLALVAGLALLYGTYEYRTDVANRIYQLREYVKARRADRA